MRPDVARRRLFEYPAYVRLPNPARQEVDGRRYHKGWEVRLNAASEAEAARIAELAAVAGFRPGRAFRKHSRLMVPLYGEDAVRAFERSRGRLAT